MSLHSRPCRRFDRLRVLPSSLLTLPAKIYPGLYQITAVGTARSALVSSAPVQIDVERQDSPLSLVTNPVFLTFLSAGSTMPINVFGIFADGKLSISHSTLTTYLSNDTRVVTVAPSGTGGGFVTAVGPGQTTVLVQYGSASATFAVTVRQPRASGPR